MILKAIFKPTPKLAVSVNPDTVGLTVGTPVVVEYVDAPAYEGAYTIAPTDQAQTFETEGFRFTENLTVEEIDPDFVGSNVPRVSGLTIDGLTVIAPAGYYEDQIIDTAVPELQLKTVDPSDTVQTVTYDANYDGLESVQVNAIPGDYVGPNIPVILSLAASGRTVTGYGGYYPNSVSTSVANAVWKSATSATPTITLTVDNVGLITAKVSNSTMFKPIQTDGWALSSKEYTVNIQNTATKQLTTVAGTTVTPTESVQQIVPAGRYTLGVIEVDAIPSDYIGSAITTRSTLSVVGKTVYNLIGYYSTAVSASVATGYLKEYNSISAVPTITVATDGKITASVSTSPNAQPVQTNGWLTNSATYQIKATGSTSTQLTTKTATTYTPTTVDQTISSGQYLTGVQTIKGDANLVASNIAKDITIFGVTGTFAGGPTITQDSTTKVVTFVF